MIHVALNFFFLFVKLDFDDHMHVCQFEGEEFVDSIKGFSTVRKEHTMFTDTNL